MAEGYLKELAGEACFLNHNFFHRNANMDWLKAYVLFYDHLVFENRQTLQMPNGLVYRHPEVWRWIQKNAVFLEDFDGMINRKELNVLAIEQLRPILLTKTDRLNMNFFRSFDSRMRLRGQGFSDLSERHKTMKELLGGDVRLGGWESEVIDEVVDAYISVRIKQSTGIASVLDPLGDFVVRKTLNAMFSQDVGLRTFEKVVIHEVPDFDRLPWNAVLYLRDSRHRTQCVRYIRNTPLNESIYEHLRDSMWRLITEVAQESSITKAALKGVIGNLPGLAVNPLGLAFAGKDTLKARRNTDVYGWIYFLSDIRKAAAESEGGYTLLPRSVRSRTNRYTKLKTDVRDRRSAR